MDKKIVFNITFHSQLEHIKFHLDVILKWKCNKNSEFVITSAHKENLTEVKEYCNLHFPNHIFDFVYLTTDYGYHAGTLFNVNEGIKYIKENKQYDYLVNVEGDNMFYDEDKFLYLLSKMETHHKHMLLIDCATKGNKLHTNYPQHSHLSKYHTLTTLNIYSKYFIENHYPLDYYEEYMSFGWGDNPGTPFEDYLGLAFNKKHSLSTEKAVEDYFNNWGYYLTYDIQWKITNHGPCNNVTGYSHETGCFSCCGESYPPYVYFAHAHIPDRFVKYGIVLFVKDLEVSKQFIEFYKPFIKSFKPEIELI